MRFHVLGIPHTVSTPEYSSCAFTQKVVKLVKMLEMKGHTVFHYGHEDSEVACARHVPVTTRADLEKAYPGHDWRVKGWPPFKLDDWAYRVFYANAIGAIHLRKERGDFLLCPFGAGHKPVADAHSDLITVESGVGYPSGTFAKFRVFESYAILHAYMGQKRIETATNDHWYDAVIPNAFELSDFEFSATKQDYLLFLGRVNAGKGAHIAVQIADEVGLPLIVAGQGALSGHEPRSTRSVNEYVKTVGVVGPDERKRLLTHAKAVICASTYLEPFCGVQIEAMASGTPVISSDWGAFAELNLHGLTGYRCRTFEQFIWAARNIGKIDPRVCRQWAENFSTEKVADAYDEYFAAVANVHGGKGWYQPNAERADLDWLVRDYPG